MTADILQDKNIFPDFHYGPLTAYREQSTMDYKKLRLAIKGEEVLRLQVSGRMELSGQYIVHPL